MYNVSNAYKAAIDNDNLHTVRGTITLTDGTVIALSTENLISNTFYVHGQCTSSTENFGIGAVYTAEMGFTFKTDISRYSLYGAVISAEFGLEIAADTFEYVPLGIFNITEATRNMDTIAVTALDNLSLMDVAYDWVNNYTIYSEEARAPQNFSERLLFCAEMSGIEYEQGIENIVAMTAFPPTGNKGQVATCREDIAQMAEWLGCFVVANRSGKIEFKPFSGMPTPVATISANRRFSASFADFMTIVASVRYVDMDNNAVTQSIPDRQGITVNLNPNSWNIPASDSTFSDDDGYLISELLPKLADVQYTPCEIEYAGNPALDVGDYITVSGGITGVNSITALICSSNWMFRGKHTIVSAGSDSRLASNANRVLSPIEVQIKNTQFLAVNQTISTFVINNDTDLNITFATDICTLKFAAQTDAMSLLYITVLYSCSADTEVQFILQINSENYKTFAEQSSAGNHVKSIVYPLMNLPNGTHKVKLRMSADSTITVLNGDASLMLQGQKLGEVTGWDGSITLHDEVGTMSITPYTVGMVAFNVAKSATFPTQIEPDITLTVGIMSVSTYTVGMTGVSDTPYFESTVQSAYTDGYDVYVQFSNAVTSDELTELMAHITISAYLGAIPQAVTITEITAIPSSAQIKITTVEDISGSNYDAFGVAYDGAGSLYTIITNADISAFNLFTPLVSGFSL